ncbi:MAG TPA: MBOAT family O-acyltransferase [Vicinamibacterales bacterium]|nr:MBOAT family O-acyltransferase [Vicinamibacterales bacterium]
MAWFIGWTGVATIGAAAGVTQVAAIAIRTWRERPALAQTVLGIAVAGEAALFLAALRPAVAGIVVPIGIGVYMCHAVSYLVDVYRGTADPRRHLMALAYLVQLPVFPSGPLARFHEFSHQFARTDVNMAGFSYGVRRIVQGLTKVYLIAGPLGSAADRIFALRVTRLSTDTAWLGAVCASLEVYFYISGFSDLGIGLGKILGLRYQENFRRPYTADSIREFWRRWNVTLITWLRDYMSLPIAGHERPTMPLYATMIAGFVVVGMWHRASLHALPWAVYSATWLAAEALGLGAIMHRLPRGLRHAYVLAVVMFGWMMLRASAPGPLLGYTEAMLGFAVAPFGASIEYLTFGFVTALGCALFFAGPMVGNVSRWRVSIDSATASLIMMLAATGVLLFHVVNGVRRVFPGPPKRSS